MCARILVTGFEPGDIETLGELLETRPLAVPPARTHSRARALPSGAHVSTGGRCGSSAPPACRADGPPAGDHDEREALPRRRAAATIETPTTTATRPRSRASAEGAPAHVRCIRKLLFQVRARQAVGVRRGRTRAACALCRTSARQRRTRSSSCASCRGTTATRGRTWLPARTGAPRQAAPALRPGGVAQRCRSSTRARSFRCASRAATRAQQSTEPSSCLAHAGGRHGPQRTSASGWNTTIRALMRASPGAPVAELACRACSTRRPSWRCSATVLFYGQPPPPPPPPPRRRLKRCETDESADRRQQAMVEWSAPQQPRPSTRQQLLPRPPHVHRAGCAGPSSTGRAAQRRHLPPLLPALRPRQAPALPSRWSSW